MTQPRLVAGIGFRHGVAAEAIVALVGRAMDQVTCAGGLIALATAADRAGESAIREAAAAFGLRPTAVDAEALRAADSRVPTRSDRIERSRGVGSLAEAAALAAAGETGHLVLIRIDDGRITCALAAMGPEATMDVDRQNPTSRRARPAQIVTA